MFMLECVIGSPTPGVSGVKGHVCLGPVVVEGARWKVQIQIGSGLIVCSLFVLYVCSTEGESRVAIMTVRHFAMVLVCLLWCESVVCDIFIFIVNSSI
jgi:hypothetical protein